jgi:hypothetical protein
MSPLEKGIIVVAVILVVIHLAGGAFGHHRYYRRHGSHPSLFYTYGLGWYGSMSLGGFRIGHRITAGMLLTLVVILVVIVAVARARLGHYA